MTTNQSNPQTSPSRRQFLQTTLGATALGCTVPAMLFGVESASAGGTVADGGALPKPSPQQLAWQECELGMFIHFGMFTFKPSWDWRSWTNKPSPNDYNPTKLNTDQWLEAAKLMGAKYAVFVAKHCIGFLQWQSNAYPYGVKQSAWRGGKGDVVREFVDSCHKYGIKPGIYASVSANAYWEVDNPGLVNRGQGGDPKKQADYARACERMLTELWSRYGELFHIWFDGGALPPEKGGPDMLPLLTKYQPKANVFQGPLATVRWIGNEAGVAPYPSWHTVVRRDDSGPGNPDGKLWLPGECDVPMPGHAWGWDPTQNTKIEPLAQLMSMYYSSVGHGCNLLLNATPNSDGLIPESNMRHYADFGKEIARCFDNSIAGQTSGAGNLVELKLAQPAKIEHVILMEDIAHGQRVRQYHVEGLLPGGRWEKLCDGVSIGHKRIHRIQPTEVAAVRFQSTKAVGEPRIRSLIVCRVPSR